MKIYNQTTISSIFFKTVEFNCREYFLFILSEDPSMVMDGKTISKQSKFV